MSFSDTIFIFFLVLVIFGPKKLPEMARQAGKLLAELRRASNEFRSQIETEISQLEVKKNLPPTPAPMGSVASLSVNPAVSESIPHKPDPAATLAAPLAEAPPMTPNPAPVSTSVPAPEPVPAANDPASQASHV
jgi:sec-independent protein translocase protein TatB